MLSSRKSYNLVGDDALESKTANGEHDDGSLLQHGISYKAKLIGSTEVQRPTSRVEIVAAMRTVRYEFKEKRIKKTKVELSVSTSGIFVNKQRKQILFRRRRVYIDDSPKLLFHHPIYRIFYVSHDSQDLKIFSYIACDSASVFKCFVFKAYRKSVAVQVVRTVGRAFDVCHQLTRQQAQVDGTTAAAAAAAAAADQLASLPPSSPAITHNVNTSSNSKADPESSSLLITTSPRMSTISHSSSGLQEAGSLVANTPVGIYRHHLRTVREKLRLEVCKSQHLTAELQLARDQLTAETGARINMQARAEHLLEQNDQLLNHIKELILVISCINSSQSDTQLGGLSTIDKDSTSYLKLSEYLPSHSEMLVSAAATGDNLFVTEQSPDSGHRDMSAYSLSTGINTPSNASWYSAPVSFNTSAVGPTVLSPPRDDVGQISCQQC